ncbi:MAG: hypothetical protein HC805_05540, partial [Alkalinema sp. RL_2_19]|nr:hypothetical protein [Alkalinema sp. RL_2_19]
MKAAIKFFLKYSVFLGVGLATAGLIAGLVSGNWDMVATSFGDCGNCLDGDMAAVYRAFGGSPSAQLLAAP